MVPSPLICKNAKIFTSVHDCCMPGLRFPYPEFVILVNGHISTTESSRSATPDTYNAANTSTATSTPSHTSRLKVSVVTVVEFLMGSDEIQYIFISQ